jgi:hypothetical protein
LKWIKIAELRFEHEDCDVWQDDDTGRVRVLMPTWIHGTDQLVVMEGVGAATNSQRYFHFFGSFEDLVKYTNETLRRKDNKVVLVGMHYASDESSGQ